MTFEKEIQRELKSIKRKLSSLSVSCEINNSTLSCGANAKTIEINFASSDLTVFYLLKQQSKLISVIQSKLGLNQTIFARKCGILKIDNRAAAEFLEKYHLMNSTACAYSYGLYLEEDLIAVSTFSKGRKMNRLPEDKRSFELIRFCTLPGYTVTGGLTRLLKHFCLEKKAGDIMTYVDRQFSAGDAFTKAGFIKHSVTEPHYFLYHKVSGHLAPVKTVPSDFDNNSFALLNNAGNIKMIYSCHA